MRCIAGTVAILLFALPEVSQGQDTTRVISESRFGGDFVDRVVQERGAQDLSQLLERHLFPPDLIMQNQSRLKITEQQRAVITGEIGKLQAAAVQMQWRMADETQKLVEHLQQPTISEEQALAQVDRLIVLEAGVKRAQLSMLIRIRNALTPGQLEMLQSLRQGTRR